jgi:hypothetical protein
MSLFDTAFLAASHRVTVIDACTLDSFDPGLKSVRLAEFYASVSEDAFEHSQELISAKPFLHTVENQADCTGGTAVQHKSQEELFLRQEKRQENSV